MTPPTSPPPPRRPVWNFLRARYRGWRSRHQLPFNFAIHLIGIPIAVLGVPLLFLTDWYWGVGALFVGYLLQWIGHRAEGNTVGELIPILKLLGLPYVAVAPRYAPRDS